MKHLIETIRQLTGVTVQPDEYFQGVYRNGELVFMNFELETHVFGSKEFAQLVRTKSDTIKEAVSNGQKRVAIHFDIRTLIDLLNPCNVPASKTHYYAWLNAFHSDNWDRLQDRRDYLGSICFRRGADTIPQKTIDTLTAIHSIHFHQTRVAK